MPHPHLTRDEAISIHALREEGDTARPALRSCAKNFYPRPPRGGRQDGRILRVDASVFLSTPSARRATAGALGTAYASNISIHALREEGDVQRQYVYQEL